MNIDQDEIFFDNFDEIVNPRPEDQEFDHIVDRAVSRRNFLKTTVVFGGIAALGSKVIPETVFAAANRFPFDSIPTNETDAITLPGGYESEVLVKWGDPIWSKGVNFDHESRGTAESQALAFGDNNDGMDVFPYEDKLLLVVNNEYTNRKIIWGNRPDGKAQTDDDILKGKMAHGVSVLEIQQENGQWSVVKDSKFNRRITPDTEVQLTGPAAGHDLLKTAADSTGTVSKGTWNNCGNGKTPWGTYLTCEENFNGYFSATSEEFALSDEQKRYGISTKDRGYGWSKIDDRFNIELHPNEANRAGYIVEIDPTDPNSKPKKRTALGRFKHENAEVVVNSDGRVVVYLGDDERGEFIYRYVSNGVYVPGGDTDSLLDDGKLYVAKFHDSGAGEWLELTPESTGLASMAEVCVHTRIAGSAVGATTMDRPEWVAANPHSAEVYCALTNNKNRGIKPNAGGDLTPVDGVNPREANKYGQIVRWRPNGSDHAVKSFAWDLFVIAGNPAVHQDDHAGSDNINQGNMFNSPDGIKFDANGMLWVQTDGKYSNKDDFAGQGNNQMLLADPVTGEIRRFLVGPKECEVTGITWSPDRRTMFVGIQHPGEKGNSHWPEGGDATPRSAIITIRRTDGGIVG